MTVKPEDYGGTTDPLAAFANTSTMPGRGAGKAIDPSRPSLDRRPSPEPQDVRPSVRSLELAAQAWCEPEASHKEMDAELATAFARILDRAIAQSDAQPVGQAELEPGVAAGRSRAADSSAPAAPHTYKDFGPNNIDNPREYRGPRTGA